MAFTTSFFNVTRRDVGTVGGKNASLGELIRSLTSQGVNVPPGFATTSTAYWEYVHKNQLDARISDLISQWQRGKASLSDTGHAIRTLFLHGDWPTAISDEIRRDYNTLCRDSGVDNIAVAVRSSATAEDLPDASFAGQQETYLNITGSQAVLDACRRCYASLFTDRAISYRQTRGFDHLKVALSVGIQRMVRSDCGSSGVMFSIDTESGFENIILINAAWGLGENVVQGAVDPDEYQVFKPLLSDASAVPIVANKRGAKEVKMILGDTSETPTQNVPTSKAERIAQVLKDEEILQLARWSCIIEKHYGCPMDMEWAKDGVTSDLFVVQARPETVHSQTQSNALRVYSIADRGRTLVTGLAVGTAAVSGRLCLVESPKDIDKFIPGSILVTSTTDPDWVPIMRKAKAIITDHGGRTSHAAIVSRELGLTAVVGTNGATFMLHTGQNVTVSCAEGDTGYVYEGNSTITSTEIDTSSLGNTRTQVTLNLSDPAAAYRWWRLPTDGIGLARMEFVVSNHIQVHPLALIHFDRVRDATARKKISVLTAAYKNMAEYFVDKLSRGLAALCASVYPQPAIIRMSDFKTNEYANLIGGAEFEPKEENPMIGWRGASRYYSSGYKEGFMLECQAIKRLRQDMGFTNAIVMIPFCRTLSEAHKVSEVMAEQGLVRGQHGLKVYVMCEIPSNVILADKFTQVFDGFSIGSNDLTQLTLGIDRDSGELADLFDEQDESVKWMITRAISVARSNKAKIGLCGQAPSNHPEFAHFLVEAGIDSISVDPSSFVAVKRHVMAAEQQLSKWDIRSCP